MLTDRITHGNSILSRGFVFSLIVAAIASPVLGARPVSAYELGVGLGEVEQGDDRLEPLATLHLGLTPEWGGDLYYYGRKFGPVRAQTFLISAYRSWPLFGVPELTAHAGISLINEEVQLKFSQAAAHSANKDEQNYNVGADFGIAYAMPNIAGPLWAQVAWDSHIFLAGLEGGIFLCSGRKETISFNIGMALR